MAINKKKMQALINLDAAVRSKSISRAYTQPACVDPKKLNWSNADIDAIVNIVRGKM